ncbi:TrmH family RNA methyltransferase [Brevibacterium sp. UBA7493]|uniref:TrmH family RNA methyltransferase n=1 Tax=Brevibacterium sp. UBA7493 TaxID=1946121 RepID=UPI00257C4246|nr:RNA methyltransferase [Brevibacterium sp. UBA7493]
MNTPRKAEPTEAEIRALAAECGIDAGRLRFFDDLDAPELAAYTQLTDVRLRAAAEPEWGIYLAESTKIIRRALAAGHQPQSFLMSRRWFAGMTDILTTTDGPIYIGTEAQIEELTGFHLHRGALAAMARPAPRTATEVVAEVLDAGAPKCRIAVFEGLVDHTNVSGRKPPQQQGGPSGSKRRSRIAVFDNIVDHTNLGAAFRSAAAIGVDAVLMTPDCADPLYRRAIRVSMGTVFQVPWARIGSWPADMDRIKEHGYVVAGMTLGEGAVTLDELVAENHPHLALVFGNEGHGLSSQVERRLDRRVTIPMMHGVDSLNVAASAAVAFYATR